MIQADVHMPYFTKFLWIGLGCGLFAAWCYYDMAVAYPSQLEVAEAYEAIPEGKSRSERWSEVAKENGWKARVPEKTADELRSLITKQKWMLIGAAALGGFLVLKYLFARGSWVKGDENKFIDSNGREMPVSAITSIDKRKWDHKGIAVLHYDVQGQSRRWVLDDFKYDREAVGKLLAIAEAELAKTDGPIVGDEQSEADPSPDQIMSTQGDSNE